MLLAYCIYDVYCTVCGRMQGAYFNIHTYYDEAFVKWLHTSYERFHEISEKYIIKKEIHLKFKL